MFVILVLIGQLPGGDFGTSGGVRTHVNQYNAQAHFFGPYRGLENPYINGVANPRMAGPAYNNSMAHWDYRAGHYTGNPQHLPMRRGQNTTTNLYRGPHGQYKTSGQLQPGDLQRYRMIGVAPGRYSPSQQLNRSGTIDGSRSYYIDVHGNVIYR